MSLLSQVRRFFFLFYKSSRPSSIKPLTAYLCNYKPFKRYSEEHRRHVMDERAPSMAMEFERVAEEKEKLRAAEQGVESQSSEKLYDGVEEATIGDTKVESAKNRMKEHEEGADYRKRGDGDET